MAKEQKEFLSLTAICSEQKLDRPSAWRTLIEKGYLVDRATPTEKGIKLGIQEGTRKDPRTGKEGKYLIFPKDLTVGILLGQDVKPAEPKPEKAPTPIQEQGLKNLHLGKYMVLSISTTGLKPEDEICELTLLGSDGQPAYSSCFKPSTEVDPEAAKLNGLTEQDLENAPSWIEEWPKIRKLMAGHRIVGHALDFARNFLFSTNSRYGLDPEDANKFLKGSFDILSAAKDVYDFPKYDLSSMAGYFGIEYPEVRRAETKANIVWKLVQKLDKVTCLRFVDFGDIYRAKTPAEMTPEEKRTVIIRYASRMRNGWNGDPYRFLWMLSAEMPGFTSSDVWEVFNSLNFWNVVNKKRSDAGFDEVHPDGERSA